MRTEWYCEVLIERMDGAARWERTVPLSSLEQALLAVAEFQRFGHEARAACMVHHHLRLRLRGVA